MNDPGAVATPQKSLARCNSRSRGINFNTVSPSPARLSLNTLCNRPTSAQKTPKHKPRHAREQKDTEPERENTHRPAARAAALPDVPFPLAEHLSSLGVDEQLRLLALKEMSVVELRDTISTLEAKLASSERDLQQIRATIQKSLYKEMTLQQPRPRRRSPPAPPQDVPGDRLSKIWTNLAKPITLIQQLDTMLQNEFEKSMVGDATTRTQAEPRDEGSDPEPSPLREKSRVRRKPNPYENYSAMDRDDMFQAVSSSLWTFVNDMKSNIATSLHDVAELYKEPKDALPIALTDITSDMESDEDDPVDLSMYSSMRRQTQTS